MLDEQLILADLDRAHKNYYLPCFSNMNIDYVASRLVGFRDETRWLLMFNSIVWWPAGEGLTTLVELVGNALPADQQGYQNDRYFVPGKVITEDDDQVVESIVVRGRKVAVDSLTITPNLQIQPERGFWVCVALLDGYKEQLFAQPEEYQRFVPAGLEKIITLDEWQHPDVDLFPSHTTTFPALARRLASGDPSVTIPTHLANSHWSHWYPK